MSTARRNGRDKGRPRTPRSSLAARPAPPHEFGPPQHLRDQLEQAARFQRSLLPDMPVPIGQFRVTSLYVPCDTVGGDFYDLAVYGESVLLLVSDVMGHGVAAAFTTMLVKSAFQETAAGTAAPGDVLAGMNGRLRRLLPPYAYVAAAVTRLERYGPDVELANAGLPHPFLLRTSRRRVEEVPLNGVPLGLFDGVGPGTYDVSRLYLGPGDVLLLASDGVGSVRSPRGQLFGDSRLRETLDRLIGRDGKEILDGLMSEANDFGGGRPLPDDIDLVAISRRAALRRAAGA